MIPETSDSPALLALLASDASVELKGRACQQLSLVGGPDAVPALAKFLDDAKLSVCARSALESITSPLAGEALLQALPTLADGCLGGAVDSLGVRREVAAVPALQGLVKDTARGAAVEALTALAKIATPEALATIQQTLTAGPAALKVPAAHAALAAARRLASLSQTEAAQPLLHAVMKAAVPAHIQAAAQAQLAVPYAKKSTHRLFDGKTFTGWEGDLAYFRIEDGVVKAGRLDRPIPQNEFLATLADYQDFELRVSMRLVGGKGNAGIQFRSQRVPNSREMIGYQADASPAFWGGLYDESRRRTFLGARPDAALIARVVKPDDWNDYVIRCEGPRIRLWLNAQPVLDFTETVPGVAPSGKIGLQIHSGGPAEAWYRQVELDELKA